MAPTTIAALRDQWLNDFSHLCFETQRSMYDQNSEVIRMAATGSKFYEVWEDTVSIRDLVRSLVVTVGLTMTGYLVAPDEPPLPLVAGLVGAVLGFIISALISTTKRNLETREADEEDEEETASEDQQNGGGQ